MLRKLDFFRFGLFLNSCATDVVLVTPWWQLKQQLRGALVAAQRRGDTALTLPLFWRRSAVTPVFFSGGIRGRAFTLSFSSPPPPHPPPVPVPNKPPRFCGRKDQNGQGISPEVSRVQESSGPPLAKACEPIQIGCRSDPACLLG